MIRKKTKTQLPQRQAVVLIKLLADRPHVIGAEVGVGKGQTAGDMLGALPGIQRLYLIDPWEPYAEFAASMGGGKWCTAAYHAERMRRCLKMVACHPARAYIVRAHSEDAAHLFCRGFFDWAFLDACHDYYYLQRDIGAWSRLVKPGGIIAGHDYLEREGWGVIQAVTEAFGEAVHLEDHYVWWAEKAHAETE